MPNPRLVRPAFFAWLLASASAFAAPSITSLVPSTGPTAGGVPLALNGSGFTGTTVEVSVGGNSCANASASSDSQVLCTLPEGVGTSQSVVVTVDGVSSSPASFSYLAPTLLTLTASQAPTTGGAALTLSGSDFGATGASVTVGGQSCPLISQNHSQAVCTLPPGQGANQAVVLSVGGQGSNSVFFSYAAPSVTSLTPVSGPTVGGVALTLAGSNFGSSGAAVTIGGRSCPLVSQVHTQIVCTVPAGTGASQAVQVEVSGQQSNTASFSYFSPSITSLSPSTGPTAGGVVLTVSGTNFGASGADVTVGGATCPVQLQTHSAIQCLLPAGSGVSKSVVVTTDGQSDTAAGFSYLAPTLTSLTPITGPTAGGIPLTLTGTNFGASGAAVTVGGVACPITQQGHTQVVCTLPPGSGTAKSVELTTSGQTSNTQTFSYAGPVLSALTPTTGPTAGGITLTLSGSNFGASGASVSLGGNNCPVTSQNHTQILCTLPAGNGANRSVVVTAGGQSSSTLNFTYAPSPPVAVAQSLSTPEDVALSIPLSATDVDGDALTFAIVSPPTVGSGSVSLDAGVALFTPVANFNGATSFTFKANDGALDSAPATVNVTVTPVNDAPVALPASATTTRNTPVTVTLTGTDVEGDALTFAITSQPAANAGTVALNGASAVFTPASGFGGSASFSFKVNDGALDSAPATVTVLVNVPAAAPIALDLSAELIEDETKSIALSATDANGDALTYAISAQPPMGEGSVTLQGGSALYTPPENFHGTTHFRFTASDAALVSNEATVTVTVKPVNDAPIAHGGAASTAQGVSVTVVLAGSDVDGDALQFSIAVPPPAEEGTASLDGAKLTFVPAPDFTGTSSLTFTVSDSVATSTGTMAFIVEPPKSATGCSQASSPAAAWLVSLLLLTFAARKRRRSV